MHLPKLPIMNVFTILLIDYGNLALIKTTLIQFFLPIPDGEIT